MSRELERLIASVAEAYYEQDKILAGVADCGFDVQVEQERMRKMLRRVLEDHDRYYIRMTVHEERVFSAEEVAARFGLDPQWVYHCKELKKIAFKRGKYLQYRESDLVKFERDRASGVGRKSGRDHGAHGYNLELLRQTTEARKNEHKEIFSLAE